MQDGFTRVDAILRVGEGLDVLKEQEIEFPDQLSHLLWWACSVVQTAVVTAIPKLRPFVQPSFRNDVGEEPLNESDVGELEIG